MMSNGAFTCYREWQDRILLLHLSGKLTASEVMKLAEIISNSRAELPGQITLDLSKVTLLDLSSFSFLKATQMFANSSRIHILIQGLAAFIPAQLNLKGADQSLLLEWLGPVGPVPLPQAESHLAGKAQGQVPSEEKAWILVVDDEETVLAYLATYLQFKGYHVLQAQDETTALCLLKEHLARTRLVLVDYLLGSASGLELAAKLVAIKPALKVILMSGLDIQQIDMAQHSMITRQLQKPFFGDFLLQTIEETLAEDG